MPALGVGDRGVSSLFLSGWVNSKKGCGLHSLAYKANVFSKLLECLRSLVFCSLEPQWRGIG